MPWINNKPQSNGYIEINYDFFNSYITFFIFIRIKIKNSFKIYNIYYNIILIAFSNGL